MNSLGSGAISAGVTASKNKLTGSCDSIGDSFVNGFVFGGLGAGIGNGTSALISKLNSSYFNSLPLSQQLFLTSNALHGLPTSNLVTRGTIIGNSVGGVVSNLPVNLSVDRSL